MKKFLLIVALFFVTICSFAHVYEIRVNQAQDGSLTWYLITYHAVNQCGHANAGLTINGINYPIDAEYGGDGALLSPNVFATVGFSFAHASYATVHTPFLGTTLSVAPYSNNVCWAFSVGGSGNFTPPPPPVCTSCPITGWSNVMAPSGNNNGTICNTSDDITTTTIKVNHLSCASITGTGKFSVIYDLGGTNISYGPYAYTSGGVETDVTINVPYGATNTTPVQVIDYSYPCNITHGLTIPGGQYVGEKETIPPSITCPAAQTICATILPDYRSSAVVSDNCTASNNIVVTQSPAAGSIVSGIVTVTLTATDAAGNQSSCNFTVTAGDTEKPAIACPANQTLNLDASCSATLPDYRNLLTVSDNCTATGSLVITQNPVAGTVVTTKGAVIVTFTVTDAAGNFNTCSISVDKKDVTAPVINCPASQTVNNNTNVCGAVVSFSMPTATDNCSGSAFNFFNPGEPNNYNGVQEDYIQLYNNGTWNDLPEGNNNRSIVEFNAVITTSFANYSYIGTFGGHTYYISNFYAGWNSSRASAQAIGGDLASINTLAEDNFLAPYGGNTWVGGYQDHNDPSYVEPGNAAQNFGGWKWVDGTKLGAGQITITQIGGLASGSTFPIGITTNTFKATDESGNSSTCSFTVTVTDNEIPIITTDGDKSVNNTPGKCEASVTVNAGAKDNCYVVAPVGVRDDAQPLNAAYPVGTTKITWNVTDIHGNNATPVIQTIVVTDNEIPVITTNGDKSVNNDAGTCGAAVAVSAGAKDNCYVVAPTGVRNDALALTDPYPVGTTTITWNVTDIHSNAALPVVQTIVVTDTESPTILSAANQTQVNDLRDCGANVTVAGPSTKDNCAVLSVTNSYTGTSDASGHYPIGTTTITWTVNDIHGNTNTATQKITVTDNENPVITGVPANINVNNDKGVCGAKVSWTDATASDNCPGVVIASNYHSGDLFPVGTTTVTYTATDAYSHTVTSSFTITVTDNEKPVITSNGDKSVNNDPGKCGATVMVSASAKDNCSVGAPAGVRSDNKALTDLYPVGTTTITWTVTDAYTNAAIPVIQTIMVTDNEKPVITCPGDVVFCANYGGITNYTINPLIASDNCAILSTTYAVTNASGVITRSGTGNNASGVFAVGVSTITWTVKDTHGNVSVCSTKVTINPLPVASYVSTNADVFCNKLTLTASSSISGSSYSWTSGTTAGSFSSNPQLILGQTSGDGIYNVFVKVVATGCISEFPAAYNFQKQNLASSYTIIAYKEVEMKHYNIVASGSVGVLSSKGEAEFGDYTKVNSPGSFVKAARIDADKTAIIAQKIYAPATPVLPTMIYNTANTKSLPNYEVKSGTVTLSGNYGNLNIKKGSIVTLSGTTFGTIHMEQGTQLTFIQSQVNIDQLQTDNNSDGENNKVLPSPVYTYVHFAANSKILVSKSVKIGDRTYLNPENNKVSFYVGTTADPKKNDDDWDDEAKFSVNGKDIKVTVNVMMPNGKLKVGGGDDGNDNNKVFTYINMTGLFIASEVESEGKNVIWNSFDCGTAAVTTTSTQAVAQSNAVEKAVVTSEEELKVTVMPNPSSTYFTLKLESKYETPVNMRVMDAQGRVVDAKSKIGSNSTIQIGQSYSSGTYYAEMIQGTKRKVVQLIKIK